VDGIDWDALRASATEAAAGAYAPYSGYVVGAAGLCAECGLVSDLHRSGGGRLVAVTCMAAPAGEPLAPGSPCGRCRQLLFEFGGEGLLVDTADGVRSMAELLPGAFGPSWLP
jgi:cytidine deaminase